MKSHIELWDSVCKTDPAHTKAFSKAGGFKGTAIKPYWLVRRATETFGPVGIGWGWTEIGHEYRAGVWCSKVRLWYSEPGVATPRRGEIEQWGQTVMEGSNKNGAYVDEEAPKKAVTDAVTKCLSYLGFAGDVHLGLFDDSKYVDELRAEFKGRDLDEQGVFDSKELREQFTDNVIQSVNAALTFEQIKDIKQLNLARLNAMKDSKDAADIEAFNRIIAVYNPKFVALKPSAPPAQAKTVDSAVQRGKLPTTVMNDEIPF